MEGRETWGSNRKMESEIQEFLKNNISKSMRKVSPQMISQNNFIFNQKNEVTFSGVKSEAMNSSEFQIGYNEHNQPFISKTNQDTEDSHVSNNKAILVGVRIRPFMEREAIKGKYVSAIEATDSPGIVSAFEYFNLEAVKPEELEEYVNESSNYNMYQFAFDRVFSSQTGQQDVYQTMGLPVVQNVMKGYNGSIIAYGQTGTGKTHTMEGFIFGSSFSENTNKGQTSGKEGNIGTEGGIVPRAVETIFSEIEEQISLTSESRMTKKDFSVECSFLQL